MSDDIIKALGTKKEALKTMISYYDAYNDDASKQKQAQAREQLKVVAREHRNAIVRAGYPEPKDDDE